MDDDKRPKFGYHITELPPPSEADLMAQKTDAVLNRLCEERSGHFTLNEVLWIQGFTQRLRYGTSVEQEAKYLGIVEAIEQRVNSRKNGRPDSD